VLDFLGDFNFSNLTDYTDVEIDDFIPSNDLHCYNNCNESSDTNTLTKIITSASAQL